MGSIEDPQHVAPSDIQKLDALIVGAGFGGVYQLKVMRDAGYHVKLVESGSDYGGVSALSEKVSKTLSKLSLPDSGMVLEPLPWCPRRQLQPALRLLRPSSMARLGMEAAISQRRGETCLLCVCSREVGSPKGHPV